MRLLNFTILFLFLSYNCFAQCETVTVESVAKDGPYAYSKITHNDGIKKGTYYTNATIYYPNSEHVGSLPSIVLCPGYTAHQKCVAVYGPFFASHGIVCMTIDTPNPFVQVPARVDAILDALETLKQENTRNDSPLRGKLDTNNMAVGGWSMGGGAAQLAALEDPNLKVIFAICPWIGDSSVNLNHNVPVLIISGQNDIIANPSQHAYYQYQKTPNSTPKVLFQFAGKGHGAGVFSKSFAQDLALSWLNYFFYDDSCFCRLLKDELLENPRQKASDIKVNFECSPLSVKNDEIINDFTIYPNPSSDFITVDLNNIKNHQEYSIYCTTGQHIKSGYISLNDRRIDVSDLPSDVYFVKINSSTIEFIKSE